MNLWIAVRLKGIVIVQPWNPVQKSEICKWEEEVESTWDFSYSISVSKQAKYTTSFSVVYFPVYSSMLRSLMNFNSIPLWKSWRCPRRWNFGFHLGQLVYRRKNVSWSKYCCSEHLAKVWIFRIVITISIIIVILLIATLIIIMQENEMVVSKR